MPRPSHTRTPRAKAVSSPSSSEQHSLSLEQLCPREREVWYTRMFANSYRCFVVLSPKSVAQCVYNLGAVFGISRDELAEAFPVLTICKRDLPADDGVVRLGAQEMLSRFRGDLEKLPSYMELLRRDDKLDAKRRALACLRHFINALHPHPTHEATLQRILSVKR